MGGGGVLSVVAVVILYVESYIPIERLRLTSPAIKQQPLLCSVSFIITTFLPCSLMIRLHGKKVVISAVILETQAARNLPSTTVSTAAVAQLPNQLD